MYCLPKPDNALSTIKGRIRHFSSSLKMAKRSDFAQKLLDDLRLRKERMASSSHNSNQSHHFPIDTYAYTKETYRGSRSTKANELVSCRTGEMLNSSSRNHRSVKSGQVSNQMVPYGKGQSSGQTGDISLALSFAFENAGKLRRTDSIMSFLHQIRRGTLEFSMSERQLVSTSHYPPGQINEISKGAQKLNQILRACSNGLNMDTYSIQFAKELLQGAIDLEESLRMLVDLQKNSEFMINPQKKNRITLLEEDNDEDDDTRMEMQLARPTFSSDKHTRDVQQAGRAIFMQRPITLTNSKEGRNSNNENNNVKMQVSHKRSTTTSSISDIRNSEGKKQTPSNPEKGRIPNVIAKLMGLDNLPNKVDVESENLMPHKIGGKNTAKGSTKKTELKNKQADSLIPMRNQKVIEAFKMSTTQGEEVIYGANKILQPQKPGSEMAIQNGKPLWRDLDGIKAPKGFDKPSIKIDKHTKSSAQKNLTGNVQEMGRKQDHPNNNNREHKGNVKGRTNDPILNNMLEQVHERPEVKSSSQEEKEINGKIVHPGKGHTNKHIMSNEKKPRNNGVQKLYVLPKNGPSEEKHRREQELQLMEEQMLKMRRHGGSEITSSKSPHQRKQLSTNHAHDLVRDEASKDTNEKVKETINMTLPRNPEFERAKQSRTKTLMDEKHVYKVASKKIKNTSKQKVDMPRRIDQVLTGRNGAKLMTKQAQPTSNKFSEAEQERVSMFREAGIGSNEPVDVAVTKPLDVRLQPPKEAPTLSSSGGGELQSQQDLVAAVPNNLHYQDVQPVAINLQDQAVPMTADEGFETGGIAFHRINGIHEDRMCVNHSQLDQNISEISTQQPLTESENNLKRILVMSQLFVNTAEALFRLNIPFNVLQGGDQENQDEGSKLILDCGYEVMKRKGIRQELKVHSCSKLSMGTTNIISLDDLVRQLNKDMENLEFYGRKRSSQVDVEDYLPKMLELDVYHRDPDIGCMWDLGWYDETFAFIEKYDVIRDTERHIVGFLLDEITGDFSRFKD